MSGKICVSRTTSAQPKLCAYTPKEHQVSTVRLTVEEARELARANAAAMVRNADLDKLFGEEVLRKYHESKTAMKRLDDVKYWIAREIENVV
jgi:hypothetical protein